ncbi:MAG: archaellin/type IV pilin N-terminal domain-containing protein [Thermoplasmata archaeon]
MKRRNVLKDDKAVSPVIATILMVAITVVLAATLYMMLPSSEEQDTPLSASISADYSETDEEITVKFTSLGTPNSAPEEDIEIVVRDDGDGSETIQGNDAAVSWSLLNSDGEVRSSSEATIDTSADGLDITPNRVTIFIDGYDGSRQTDL